jgi:uncharacterized protein (DUF2147 family)
MLTFLADRFCASLIVWLLAGGLACVAAADTPASIAGYWKSIDDVTGQPDAEVKITEAKEQYVGTIVRDLITPATDKPLVCDKCTDDRKGKPIVGMEIIRYARYNPAADAWEGGQILDPDEGKVYRLTLKLLDSGKKLQVRGYYGPIYRTQIWEKLPSPYPYASAALNY